MAKKTLDLISPIKINGKTYKKLSYDFEQITVEGFSEALSEFPLTSGQPNYYADPKFDIAVAMAAIIAVNPSFDYNDLRRLRGSDVIQLTTLGLNFIYFSEDDSLDETSDDVQDSTADTTAQV